MGTLLEFKKHIKPAVSREDFIDMFFDKKKRQAIYRRFDEKADEPKEDDFVNSMKKKMIHFDE